MEMFYECSQISFLRFWVSLPPASLGLLGGLSEDDVSVVPL